MNATLLYHQDGNPSGVAYCGKCRIVHPSEMLAEQCCKPHLCKHCGNECQRYHVTCPSCDAIERARREASLFEAAEKVTEWAGPVFSEGLGWRDGYFENIDELKDWLACEERERPEYVWTCDARQFVNVDFDSIAEGFLDEAYEEWDSDLIKGEEEFRAAIEKFNEVNKDQVVWHPNYKRALLI